jgi:hypothetical protein
MNCIFEGKKVSPQRDCATAESTQVLERAVALTRAKPTRRAEATRHRRHLRPSSFVYLHPRWPLLNSSNKSRPEKSSRKLRPTIAVLLPSMRKVVAAAVVEAEEVVRVEGVSAPR